MKKEKIDTHRTMGMVDGIMARQGVLQPKTLQDGLKKAIQDGASHEYVESYKKHLHKNTDIASQCS